MALLDVAQEACKQAGIDNDRIVLIGDGRDSSSKFKHFTTLKNISGTARFRKAKIDPWKDHAFYRKLISIYTLPFFLGDFRVVVVSGVVCGWALAYLLFIISKIPCQLGPSKKCSNPSSIQQWNDRETERCNTQSP